jgi:hypothetical protein
MRVPLRREKKQEEIEGCPETKRERILTLPPRAIERFLKHARGNKSPQVLSSLSHQFRRCGSLGPVSRLAQLVQSQQTSWISNKELPRRLRTGGDPLFNQLGTGCWQALRRLPLDRKVFADGPILEPASGLPEPPSKVTADIFWSPPYRGVASPRRLRVRPYPSRFPIVTRRIQPKAENRAH